MLVKFFIMLWFQKENQMGDVRRSHRRSAEEGRQFWMGTFDGCEEKKGKAKAQVENF